MKKKLFILWILILCISLNAQAQHHDFWSVINGKTIYFKITDNVNNKVKITSELPSFPYYNIKPTGGVLLPDSIINNGTTYTVTSIGENAFHYCDSIVAILLPNNITTIEGFAFSHCTGLTGITIPSLVTSIGNFAFSYCTNLEHIISNPINPPTVQDSTFHLIPNTTILHIYSNDNNVNYRLSTGWSQFNCHSAYLQDPTTSMPFFSGNNILYFIITSNVEPYEAMITYQAFTLPHHIPEPMGEVAIPATITHNGNTYTVTSIGHASFSECEKFTSLTIPNTVTRIEQEPFRNCLGLTTATLPNSITSIQADMFRNCRSLTSVNIPTSITSLPFAMFRDCSSLNSITIPNNITSIENSAFNGCVNLTSITIPSSVTIIGKSAFSGCRSLTSVTIPNSVDSIGSFAFSTCYSLQTITLPDSLTRIEAGLFSSCTSLSSVTIPNTVKYIGHLSFKDCINLTTITIPSKVFNVDQNAFNGCTGLTSITCQPVTPPYTSASTFERVPKDIPVYVPCGSLQNYQSAANWQDFTNIQCLLGIDEIPTTTDLQTKIYPNPTNGIATLEIEAQTKAIDVFVYDVMGRNIKTYNLKANQTELNIDLTSFPKGIYQVKVENQTKKLIVN